MNEIDDIRAKFSEVFRDPKWYFKNDDSEETRKSKVNAFVGKIKEEFSSDKSIELTNQKIEELFLNNLYSVNVTRYYDNKRLSDYNEDLRSEEKLMHELYEKCSNLKNSILYEILIQKANPKDISLQMIDELKYTKTVENNGANRDFTDKKSQQVVVIPPIFHKMLEQYIENMNPNKIDESLLAYMYQNGYQGKISNPMLACCYKEYCEVKDQAYRISSLKSIINKQDGIININEYKIGVIFDRINSLNSSISTLKNRFTWM